jgi:hypothetical protein
MLQNLCWVDQQAVIFCKLLQQLCARCMVVIHHSLHQPHATQLNNVCTAAERGCMPVSPHLDLFEAAAHMAAIHRQDSGQDRALFHIKGEAHSTWNQPGGEHQACDKHASSVNITTASVTQPCLAGVIITCTICTQADNQTMHAQARHAYGTWE